MAFTDQDYFVEKRLRMLNPPLHRRFTDAIIALQKQFANYRAYFPEYTDHSNLHVMTVLDYCNKLMREQDKELLNADELYVLLMSCYLHDIGMGIREEDYEEFCQELGLDKYSDIRKYHHEFSGCYIRKYAELLDLPSEEHTFAVAQISRGHRKTDLFNPDDYPEALSVPGGNTICMPYLAAILRLADELDVTIRRNPAFLFDISQIKNENQIMIFKEHIAMKDLIITRDACIIYVDTEERDVYDGVAAWASKIQNTLDYCTSVVSSRTPYEITQRRILLQEE